ncbi:kinesin-II 95 kDa subunit-like [Ctenocephalides felis]|uniref:kinesin-II 95 kDa subunit-like n=1 Tax=Ctenocephalides felis TaxID=7515 RepID=UPI000E6E146B|nr:kinesin-II 95 kDa subunit-like [Ctenocephalides felis]
MVQNNIKVFARIKPERYKEPALFEIHSNNSREELVIYPPKRMNRSIKNSPFKYKFYFDKIFRYNSEQMEVFQTVAIPILQQIKTGCNGTIFAYGQTGSGKTFTMLGSILPNCHRGIIPRILQNLFNDKSTMRVSLSYLEIYKDIGVDLLSRNCQKVTVQEDEKGMHLKHLQKVNVLTIAEAMKILQIGENNRKVSGTKYNTRSSRSHCILTIRYEGSHKGKVIQSYLHLVDLAGSERFKAHLRASDESIHINKSLHFLEVVINALTYPTLHHIPYRNSLVTSVLKDSLNANSFTSMIATLSLSEENALETLSSCRFASRMSKVKNCRVDASKPSKIDTKAQMLSLQDEVQRLHGLLVKDTTIRTECYNHDLTDEDKRYCDNVVTKFLSEDNDSLSIPVTESKHIQECFRIIRKRVKQFQKDLCNENPKLIPSKTKGNYETTYNKDYTIQSRNKITIKHKDNDIKNNYDERPIRSNFLQPIANDNKKNVSNFNKTKNKTICMDNKGVIDFDEYLENNLYKPNNSSRTSSKKINTTKILLRQTDSIISQSSLNSNKENSFISVSKIETNPNNKISTRSVNAHNSKMTQRSNDSIQTKIPVQFYDKNSEHPGPNYYPVSARESCSQNSFRPSYNRKQVEKNKAKSRTNLHQKIIENNIDLNDIQSIQKVVNEIIKKEVINIATKLLSDKISSPQHLNLDDSILFNQRPQFNSTENETTKIEEHWNDSSFYKNQLDLSELNASKSFGTVHQNSVNKTQVIDHISPQNNAKFDNEDGKSYRNIVQNPSSSEPNLTYTRVPKCEDHPMPSASHPRCHADLANHQNFLNSQMPKMDFAEAQGDYSLGNKNLRSFGDDRVTNPLASEPVSQSEQNIIVMKPTIPLPNILMQYAPSTSNIMDKNYNIPEPYISKLEEPHPFSCGGITECARNSNQNHDVFILNTNSPILNHNKISQSEQCAAWEPKASLNVCADNISKQKHYILPGTESKVPLTGDKDIDEEIIKFYKCRELAKITAHS